MNITISDTTFSGDIIHQIELAINNERTTLQDLIIARVIAEVEKYNQNKHDVFRGLVQPSESEKVLNGFKVKAHKKIDAEKQSYIALEAFKKNAFFVLVDEQQVESLEDEIFINQQTVISFIKLTPLVGG